MAVAREYRIEALEEGNDAAGQRVVYEGGNSSITAALIAATMATMFWYLFICLRLLSLPVLRWNYGVPGSGGQVTQFMPSLLRHGAGGRAASV
ncbi:MAG: hypothetical protein ACOZB1_17095 [Pseudomonadota bacterium]